ncbi:DUF2165 domain-containing protein [Nocardia sp. CDC153]|uniref:DUF2165 domain-containing protein n=1 Tax=Nocardia sp. CDC153 TaxID=3112167 RepID=UPI002DB6CBF6|nr:DUF2165 domain-containing protein [Nocardia sp. CDC153]MEC3953433.1 DUF2165 domain-containing protein [Nocardia sp. CDC153]
MRMLMRFLEVGGSRRAAVAVLAGITALYYLIVAITNCTDPHTNRRGVAAVFSMDKTIHDASTDWHAIHNSTVVLIAYILIVIWEFSIAFVMVGATIAWIRALRAGANDELAVRLSSLGWMMAVLLFFGGFLTIGGEWFRMWANKEVNASSAALQNFLIAAVGLILVHLREPRSGSARVAVEPGGDERG